MYPNEPHNPEDQNQPNNNSNDDVLRDAIAAVVRIAELGSKSNGAAAEPPATDAQTPLLPERAQTPRRRKPVFGSSEERRALMLASMPIIAALIPAARAIAGM